MHIIAIANRKGGTGKTTTSVNLSSALALAGHKVLLVDWDPQKNATTGLGMKDEVANYSGFTAIPSNIPNLDIFTSNEDLNIFEENAIKSQLHLRVLQEKLQKLQYPYIIIDCAPSLSWLTLNALAAASDVLIPMQCEFYSLEGLSQLYQMLELMQLRNYKCKLHGIVFTMYDARNRLTNAVHQDVAKYFGDKVYKTTIPRNVRLAEAPSYGKPCITYAPKSFGAEAYQELAKEFLLRINNH